jgi:hypothetical protein
MGDSIDPMAGIQEIGHKGVYGLRLRGNAGFLRVNDAVSFAAMTVL